MLFTFSAQELPTEMQFGPRMIPTANKTGLLMTYGYEVFSFHCKTNKKCYWVPEDYQLQIERYNHIMMAVPSSLVANCGCEVDATPCGCKDPVPVDDCKQCRDGYWGLDEKGCKSKFVICISECQGNLFT